MKFYICREVATILLMIQSFSAAYPSDSINGNCCSKDTSFDSDEDVLQFITAFKEYAATETTYAVLTNDGYFVDLAKQFYKRFPVNVILMNHSRLLSNTIYTRLSEEYASVFIFGGSRSLTDFANLAQRNEMFQTRSVFCFVTRTKHDLNKIRKEISLTAQERVFVAYKVTTEYDVIIKALFHNYKYGYTDTQTIGTWSLRSGLHTVRNVENCCYNLSGAYLTVVTVEHEPYVKISSVQPDLFISGVCVDIMTALKDDLGFEFSVYEAPDGKFGVFENGRWNGMIAELVNKEADIAMGAFSVNHERMMYVEFTHPFVEGYLAIFYRKIDGTPDSLKNYVNVFSLMFWLISLLSCFVLAFLWAASESTPVVKWFRLLIYVPRSMSYMMCALVQQCSSVSPRRFSTKAAMLTLYMFVSFLFLCYTSVLTSFITVTTEELPFKNIDELIKHPHFAPIFVEGTIDSQSAKASSSLPDAEWRKILSDEHSYVSTYKEGVERALAEQVAFVGFTNIIVAPDKVPTNMIVDKGVKDTNSMSFQKQSPFYRGISNTLLKLEENGAIRRILSKYETSSRKSRVSSSKLQVIDLQHSLFTFVIATIGIIVTILILLIEKFYNYSHV